jgi:hypothetical protein
MLNQDIWSERIKPNDWRWELAEATCRDIAGAIRNLDQPRLGSAQFMSGYKTSPPWVWNPRSDRVIAYHGFHGTWVGWDRGGPVIPLPFTEVVRFLRKEA